MPSDYQKTAQPNKPYLEIENTPKRCRGRPKTKWIDTVKKQLKQLNVTHQDAKDIAIDRKKWNQIINRWCKISAECSNF